MLRAALDSFTCCETYVFGSSSLLPRIAASPFRAINFRLPSTPVRGPREISIKKRPWIALDVVLSTLTGHSSRALISHTRRRDNSTRRRFRRTDRSAVVAEPKKESRPRILSLNQDTSCITKLWAAARPTSSVSVKISKHLPLLINSVLLLVFPLKDTSVCTQEWYSRYEHL